MKFNRFFSLGAVAMFIGCDAMAQTPDLVGTWTGEVVTLLQSEGELVERATAISVVIEKVNGNHIFGYRTWKIIDKPVPGYVGDVPLTSASEKFIGAISSDGDTLRLVEVEDRGIMFGEVLGPDEIEFTYIETAPHPVAFTGIYHREQ